MKSNNNYKFKVRLLRTSSITMELITLENPKLMRSATKWGKIRLKYKRSLTIPISLCNEFQERFCIVYLLLQCICIFCIQFLVSEQRLQNQQNYCRVVWHFVYQCPKSQKTNLNLICRLTVDSKITLATIRYLLIAKMQKKSTVTAVALIFNSREIANKYSSQKAKRKVVLLDCT